ncbi:MAG: sialate O-acetylesterase [Bacteroidia bacterium]
MRMKLPAFAVICFLLILTSASAQIKLPQIIGDHMVLQQHQPVPIWGWAKKNEKITVSFLHHTLTTKAGKNGAWRVNLPSSNAGGPYEMIITGKNETIRLTDILIGEVWICSGQSNMEWPLNRANDAEKEVRQANYPSIRLFTVKKTIAFSPKDNLSDETWTACSPETVGGFSAVGYFFGRKLHLDLDVPVGLISSNWGGTNVETWTSKEAITQVEGFERSTDDLLSSTMEKARAEKQAKYDIMMAEFGETKGGIVDGKPVWADPNLNIKTWKVMELPGLWESKGLEGLDGEVWFRKVVDIPAELAGQEAEIHLGPIDDSDVTWVNGEPVGETHQQYNVPRVYKIPQGILRAGRNTIAVKVEDTGGGGGLYGRPEDMFILVAGDHISLRGDWLYRISPQGLWIDVSPFGPNDRPTLLFNGMIAPLIPYAIQGVIWYQGESNASRAYQYRTLFPTMIQDWRNHWNRDFPFLFVQLANFMAPKDQPGESEWAELREAQNMTLNLHKTGQALAIDIGEADDIHPRNKQDVGYRLALAALKIAYEKSIVYSGPTYRSMQVRGNKIVLDFENTGSGMEAHDRYGYLRGFAIAGADKHFVWAKAEIQGNQIVVWSEEVPAPVAVRYAWADNPDDANLYNKEGLPAGPFRTDLWEGITVGRK